MTPIEHIRLQQEAYLDAAARIPPLLGGTALALVAVGVFFWARRRRDPLIGFAVLVVLVPVTRTFIVPGLGPRIVPADAAFVGLAGAALLLRGKGFHRPPGWLVAAGALLVAGAALSVLASRQPVDSAVEVVALAYAVMIGLVIAAVVRSREETDGLIRAWMIGGWVVWTLALVGFLHWLGVLDAGRLFVDPRQPTDPLKIRIGITRVISTFARPSQLASYAVPSLFLGLAWYGRGPGRRSAALATAWAVLAAIATTTSGSRAGLVALAVGVVIWFGVGLRHVLRPRLVLPLLFVCASLAALIILPKPDFSGRTRTDALASHVSVQNYNYSWRAGEVRQLLASFAKRPVTGQGIGTFIGSYTTERSGRSYLYVHNSYLGTAAETGIVGAIGLVILVFGTVGALWRARRALTGAADRILVAGFASALGAELVLFAAHYGLRQRHFWVLIGLATAVGALHHQRA